MGVVRFSRGTKVLRVVGLACSVVATVLSLSVTPAHAAVTFNVNSTADSSDSNPGNGICATAGGQCTLRAAIQEANALAGTDTVNVPAGTYTVGSRIEIQDSLNLIGAGTGSTTISGGGIAPMLYVRTVEYLVCDSNKDKVWSYDRNGQRNGTFVNAGSGGLDMPLSAHVGDDNDPLGPGDVFVTGFTSGIHRYDGRTGANQGLFVAPGAGGLLGPTDAVFGPSNSGTSPLDELFVTKYQPGGGILRYDGQTGSSMGTFVSAGSAGLAYPNSLAFRGGNLYATSAGSHAVLRYNGTTGASMGAFVSSFSGGLSTPRGLLFAPDGSLLVSSWDNDRVLRYNGTTGAFLGTLVAAGSGGLDRPTHLALGPDNTLLVVSSGNKKILRYNLSTGAFKNTFATGGSATYLDNPSCLLPRQGVVTARS